MDKKRLLVIDDEPAFARALKSYLEATGQYEVCTAQSAEQGLEAARAIRPDLLLLDIIMPDRDGGYLAAQLKADERIRHIPVIFLTAVVSRDEAKAHPSLIGGQRFIAKPVSAKEVLDCVERCLRDAPQTRSVAKHTASG